jgi:hypothetical protein
MGLRSFFLLLVVSMLFLLFPGCSPYYLSVCQEWMDVRYLASNAVNTPDPRQDHPPIGQMLILDWRVPREVFRKKPVVVLDLILWDYTTRQIRIPITRRMDYTTWRLLDADYEKTGGILTYRAEIVTEDGSVFREWKHQLWVNLITIGDQPETETEEKASSAE